MSHNDNNLLTLVPILEGCRAKHLCFRLLLRHGLSQLVPIALICGVPIPSTIVLPDAAVNARVAIMMRFEHRVVFSSEHAKSQDCGRS